MSSYAIHMVFSPQSCPLTLLEETLTHDRRLLAKQLLQQIRKDIDRNTASHTLIVGPRGSGKTHLLAFVRKSLEASPEITSELLIIPLAEEEHGLTTLLDFLLAALRSGRHDIRLLNPDFGIRGQVTALADAIEAFDKVAAGRAVLILLENLGSIFAALELGEVDRLRAFLQSHPRVALLASAVELFADSARPDHPFHGFFSIEPLRPLNRREARAYLAQLAGAKGDKDLEALIQAHGAGPRVDAIYDLTGGNHRLLAMLSTFLTVDGFADLVGPFVQMVDRELTPYYQHRLDRLSPQQKKILMCITDHHGRALSVKDIAHYAFSTSQVVSRQLADLLHGAFVRRTKMGRESFYELNEPLLRLVLDIKEGHDRPLPLIVAFLHRWHGLRELQQLEDRSPASLKAYYTTAIEQALNLPDLVTGEWHPSAGFARSELVRHGKDKHPETGEASELLSRAHALESQGEPEQAIAIYDEVVQRFGSSDQPEMIEPVAKALFNKGFWLDHLKRFEEAIATYEEFVRRFGSGERPELLEWVAQALCNRGFTLETVKRFEEANAAYDEVARRFGSSDQPGLLECVARALVNKAHALSALNRPGDAMAVYDELVQRFGSSTQSELFQWVAAQGFLFKGLMLGELNRYEEALTVYDEVVRRFGPIDQPGLFVMVAIALIKKGETLRILNRLEEAIVVNDEVMRRFGRIDRPQLAPLVAMALVNKGFMLSTLKRSEEAIASYDEVVFLFGSSDQPELVEAVAIALINKGITLATLKRSEEASAVYDEVLLRYGSSDQPELLEPVAGALAYKASLEFENGRLLEALELSERALSIVSTQPRALEIRIRALFWVGKVTEAFHFLRDWLSNLQMADPVRTALAAGLIGEAHGNIIAMRELVEIYRETPEPLSVGLLRWLQKQLPMSADRAKALEKSEQVIVESFGRLPECSVALQVLSAVRQHALGHREALFRLPLEIRRLVMGQPDRPCVSRNHDI